jgi:acetylornithine deacetylase
MQPIDVVALVRSLVDIDSTTGREGEVARWVARLLRERGYRVTEQPVTDGRWNVFARLGPDPAVVFSTHLDCVPPFFASRVEGGLIFGRGACDAKGIAATQIAAAEALRQAGETRIGLLFLTGEESGSDGARLANQNPPEGVRFLINGEPTENRLGIATRGSLRVRLVASGRAAHSSYPELGESAIDKLLDALMLLRGIALPEDPVLGRTHYTVGLIEGGVAPNVVSPAASAEIMFRIVSRGAVVLDAIAPLEALVAIKEVLDVPVVRLHTVPGFETAVFPYTSDVPMLTHWGTPLLLGPGTIHVAHTAHEHVPIEELNQAVELYAALARQLLSSG